MTDSQLPAADGHPITAPEYDLVSTTSPGSGVRSDVLLDDGTRVRLRLVRPDDEYGLVALHLRLSERAVTDRYLTDLSLKTRIAHERLERVCHPDEEREIVLVAEQLDRDGESDLIGVARLDHRHIPHLGEISVLIADHAHRQVIGVHLLEMMIAIAVREHLHEMFAVFLPQNDFMRSLCEHCGFATISHADDPLVQVSLPLPLGGG